MKNQQEMIVRSCSLKRKKKAAGVISHSRESRRRSRAKGREKDKVIRKEAMAIVAFVAQTLREGA